MLSGLTFTGQKLGSSHKGVNLSSAGHSTPECFTCKEDKSAMRVHFLCLEQLRHFTILSSSSQIKYPQKLHHLQSDLTFFDTYGRLLSVFCGYSETTLQVSTMTLKHINFLPVLSCVSPYTHTSVAVLSLPLTLLCVDILSE